MDSFSLFKKNLYFSSFLVLGLTSAPYRVEAMETEAKLETSSSSLATEKMSSNKKKKRERKQSNKFSSRKKVKTETPSSLIYPLLTTEGWNSLITEANNGNTHAQDEIAERNLKGILPLITIKQVNVSKWENIRKKACEKPAYTWLFYTMFMNKMVSSFDDFFPDFFQQVRNQSDNNSPLDQYMLGRFYQEGIGVQKNLEEGNKLIVTASNKNFFAQHRLGLMYQHGLGVKKDYTKAIEWYEKSAQQGYALAQCNLGVMHEYGFGIKQDYTKAVELYEKSAQQGYALAQCNLGMMYERGRGIGRDHAKAIEWYEKSAQQGYAQAQMNYFSLHSSVYLLGTNKELIVTSNDISEQALSYLRQAGYAGLGKAVDLLFKIYANGVCKATGGGILTQILAPNPLMALSWGMKIKNDADAFPKLRSFLTISSSENKIIDIDKKESTDIIKEFEEKEGIPLEVLISNARVEFILSMAQNNPQATLPYLQESGIPVLHSFNEPLDKGLATVEEVFNELKSPLAKGLFLTNLTLKREVIGYLTAQENPPFAARHFFDGKEYLTLGERNVPLAEKIAHLLKPCGEAFSLVAENMIWKDLPRALRHQACYRAAHELKDENIKTEEIEKLKKVNATLQNAPSFSKSNMVFQEGRALHNILSTAYVHAKNLISTQIETLTMTEEELKGNLPTKLTAQKNVCIQALKELEKEHRTVDEKKVFFDELEGLVKDIIVRGAASRNKDFLEEYPFLKQ